MIPHDKKLGPLFDISDGILTDGENKMRINEPAKIKKPPLNNQQLHW
jgi:hypothetical protein